MASGTQEKDLEQRIEDHLCEHGYHALAPQGYERALGLVPAEVLGLHRGHAAVRGLNIDPKRTYQL